METRDRIWNWWDFNYWKGIGIGIRIEIGIGIGIGIGTARYSVLYDLHTYMHRLRPRRCGGRDFVPVLVSGVGMNPSSARTRISGTDLRNAPLLRGTTVQYMVRKRDGLFGGFGMNNKRDRTWSSYIVQ